MKNSSIQSRRRMLKIAAAALTMIPVVAIAAKNDKMRATTKYKDTPEGDKKCSNCNLFIPGPQPTDLGGCKIYPGDTEVAPEAFCIAWMKKA